jgi:hypothetical protein
LHDAVTLRNAINQYIMDNGFNSDHTTTICKLTMHQGFVAQIKN